MNTLFLFNVPFLKHIRETEEMTQELMENIAHDQNLVPSIHVV